MLPIAKLVTTFFNGIGDCNINSVLTISEIQTLARFALCCLTDLDQLGAAFLRLRTCAIITKMGRPIVDEWSSGNNFDLVHRATRALTELVVVLRNGMPLSTSDLQGEFCINHLIFSILN